MGKKSSETAHLVAHNDLKDTLMEIRKKASEEANLEIGWKEASILANEKIKRARKINWMEAKEILFNYGYKKRR